jgi:hypothetical protein
VVTDVQISVHGTGLSDSGSIGMIHPDDGEVDWYSDVSNHVEGSGSVTVSGEVEITYTPNTGPMPTSGGMHVEDTREISLSYSATIDLEDDINPAEVGVRVEPSENPVEIDTPVTFTVIAVSYTHLTLPTIA